MKKLIVILVFFLSATAFGQSYSYIFKVVGVSTPVEAKQTIAEFRAILKIRAMYFNDNTDEFRLVNKDYPLNMEEIQEDLNTNGIFLESGYEYFVNE
jgi:hypothetical protein